MNGTNVKIVHLKPKINILKKKTNLFHLEDVKWYDCEECPFKTKHKKSLKKHVMAKHLHEEKIRWYECED